MPAMNWTAILVSTVVIFILGWLYYSPLLFYKPWMRARGLDPAAAMTGAKMPMGRMLVELIRCFVLSLVLVRLVDLVHITSVLIAVHFSGLMWLGFPVVLLVGSVIWENVPKKVALIHSGDWLVKMVVIPIIAVVMHK